MSDVTEWIGAADAARRLGIKPASLYSYVSRGVLARRTAPDGRTSQFDAAEVDQLARKGRPRRPAGKSGLIIGSALTEIRDGELRYRGLDAVRLAAQRSFEDVAELLWTGTMPAAPGPPWRATEQAVAVAAAAQAALPEATLPLERLQVIVPALAATDPLRLELGQPAVVTAARSIIAGMTDCLPEASPESVIPPPAEGVGAGSIAGRLVSRLCPAEPPPGLAAVLQSALVLTIDHELAASTVAARAAASVRADPYAVVATGLGAVGGALHGGASLGAELMLDAAAGPADAPRVIGELLRRGERIPGFGHFVYTGGDPRAMALLAAVRRLAPGSAKVAVAGEIISEAHRRGLPQPNIDFALAALATAAGLIRGAGEAIFAVARAAGWLAHGIEEYQRATPIRPRGIYTGPAGDRESAPPAGH
ncbi:MAG TPA: citrate/2-methylcitrate synthase [Streptosporangiaceae bacterium]|nr:citrate/2-methylcitrate synthase [Streptosporangiaceae bacterium]